MTAILERETALPPALAKLNREPTAAELIFFENPHGPDWAERLRAALRTEYGADWIGPCIGDRGYDGMSRYVWAVRS